MGDAIVSDVIVWNPYETLGNVYWPKAALGSSFWYRRHFDVDNIIGPYEHYSAIPTFVEINAGWGLNQIIALEQLLGSMWAVHIAPPSLVMPPLAGSRSVGRFPLEWGLIKSYVNLLRSLSSTPVYSWTLPFDDLDADPQTSLSGKNKISFIDLTEFRDALNAVPLKLLPYPILVSTPNAQWEEKTFETYEAFGVMNERAGKNILDSNTKNKYQWTFVDEIGANPLYSKYTGLIHGISERNYDVGLNRDERVYGGMRFLFQFLPNLAMGPAITGLKIKGRMKKDLSSAHYGVVDSIIRVFAPPTDPSLMELSEAGALGDPLRNAVMRPMSFSVRYSWSPHRSYVRPATPLIFNDSYWPDCRWHYADQGSWLLSAVAFSNVDIAAWLAQRAPNLDLTINGTKVINWNGGVKSPDTVWGSYVLLFGQTNTDENGLWIFWVDDVIGGWRPHATRQFTSIPPPGQAGCLLGTQWLFGWPGNVDGQLWWITNQLPDLSSSSSSSEMPGSSLSSTSCNSGFSFREMTEWETRFLNIYDTPLLGTELGSIDTASFPSDNAYHDVEINLTGLPAWLSSSDRTYFVMAIDTDLIKLRLTLPTAKPIQRVYNESYRVMFNIQSIIPQV